MPFGAILGGLGAIGGSILGSRAQAKADKRATKLQMANIERALGLLREGETSASQYLRQSLGLLEQAQATALGQTAQAEFQARRSIGDAYRQDQAGMTQSLARRGLYNTTVYGASQRGALNAYARNVTQLGAQMAGLRSQIAMQGGGARAQALSNLGQLSMQTAQSSAQLLGNVQYQAPQGIAAGYGMLGAGIGDVLGGAIDGWSAWSRRRADNQQAANAYQGKY